MSGKCYMQTDSIGKFLLMPDVDPSLNSPEYTVLVDVVNSWLTFPPYQLSMMGTF